MALSVAALLLFIFGAYAYAYLLVLSLRRWLSDECFGVGDLWRARAERVTLALFLTCTVWFVIHAIIEFRYLLGEPRENDLIDLAALELVYLFPGLVLHMYLYEARPDDPDFARTTRWRWLVWALYAAGVACAAYFTGAIYEVLPRPRIFAPLIGLSIGSLFTITSVVSLILMRGKPKPGTPKDTVRLRRALRMLFFAMIGMFVALNLVRFNPTFISALDVAVRAIPLYFLLVSVYFESRNEFYDLVLKRGTLLVFGLLLTGGTLTLGLGLLDSLPEGGVRPWLLAVLLLPVAIVMPWLHDRAGRLLDRLWFGRIFTPVEAVKHVLSAMHHATSERELITSTEAALTDIFRRRVAILVDGAVAPEKSTVVAEIKTPAGGDPVRMALLDEPGARTFSEDLALLRSLAGVFGYLLENIRLQRKRQEQEQVAQELRLQSSRSELKALRAQINPHFLFNALNAIASLIHTDPARADAAVEQLAEVFRYTLRRSDSEWAPLDQELAFARAYLDVEQARFGKRLAYAIQADDGVLGAHVPSMLLQTLVENAVKHGISRLRTAGRIVIAASRRDDRVTLEVRDTGPGPQASAPPGNGERFGLRSVRDRLRGHFGTNASLTIERDGDVTVARIEMPLIENLSLATGAAR